MAREAISAVLDVDEESFDVTIEAHLGDSSLDELVESVRRHREAAEQAQREASVEMERAVRLLREQVGLSMRDVAKLLGISHQRVGQISRC
jgi:DNA-binding transcriptional regulator YiaG